MMSIASAARNTTHIIDPRWHKEFKIVQGAELTNTKCSELWCLNRKEKINKNSCPQ